MVCKNKRLIFVFISKSFIETQSRSLWCMAALKPQGQSSIILTDLMAIKAENLDNLTLYRKSLLISVLERHSPKAVFCGGGEQGDKKGFKRYVVPL